MISRLNPAQAFNFLPIPTDIHFGCGIVERLPNSVKAVAGSRVLLVTDEGLCRAGLVERVERILTAAGIPVTVFDRVKPDSGSELIHEAVSLLRDCGADAVAGLGGGSSLDTAKAVAAIAANGGTIFDYVGLNRLPKKPLPVIAIPTTAGTGSEVSLWSVFTDDSKGLKLAIGSVLLYPSVALCDPELTFGLSPCLTAATGMDALGHAIECYSNDACQPISGVLALYAIQLISRFLRTAVLNGSDRDARYAVMLASTMAGIAMNPTRLGLAHAFAMPLGSWDLHIAHGLAIGIMLPVVMRFNYLAQPARYRDIAEAMGEPVGDLPLREAAGRAHLAVRTLADDVGLPPNLAAVGLKREDIPRVAEEAIKSGNVAVNPRRAGLEDLKEILRQALEEGN
jgi:alcohol dehydrogenase